MSETFNREKKAVLKEDKNEEIFNKIGKDFCVLEKGLEISKEKAGIPDQIPKEDIFSCLVEIKEGDIKDSLSQEGKGRYAVLVWYQDNSEVYPIEERVELPNGQSGKTITKADSKYAGYIAKYRNVDGNSYSRNFYISDEGDYISLKNRLGER